VSASDDSALLVSAWLDLPSARDPVTLARGKDRYTGRLSLRPLGATDRCFVGQVSLVVRATDAAGHSRDQRVQVILVPAGMVLIPGGEYRTGSNAAGYHSPPRRIETSDPFFVDVHEVSNRRYQAFVDRNPAALPRSRVWVDGHYRDTFGKHPVQGVSYLQAHDFARFSKGRLPTEVEWEKAAAWSPRRHQQTSYPWGPDVQAGWANTSDYWTQQRGQARATPVGHFDRDISPYGCYDMCGNVQEWATGDDASPGKQVLKGGCYLNRQAAATCSRREELSETAKREQVGFRCVRDLTPGEQQDP
jgi:formylglycine-generating enzyme required for sulfatase activity